MASGGVWNTQRSFLAQLRDGSLEAWGHPDYGAPIPADIIASGQKHGLKRAWSTWQGGFLVELQNGEFHAWGNKEKGADIDAVKATLEREGVVQIWSTGQAFLAELTSGKVLTWGRADYGGDVATSVREALEAEGIQRAWSTRGAFIVELKSGRVVAWGDSDYGSQIPSDAQAAMRTKGLRDIWTTRGGAVVAQLNTGEVISWGDTRCGADLGGVKDRLEAAGVRRMWSTLEAFLAQLKTGEILCWGAKNYGGALPAGTKEALDAHGVARAWSTNRAFLAELTNGSVVAWGVEFFGATIPDDLHGSLEREGIREAFGMGAAFLVVLKSGRCVAWGHDDYGADLSSVKDKLETVGLALSAPAAPAAVHSGDGSSAPAAPAPSGCPAFCRSVDLSPVVVKLTEKVSNSSWVSRAMVKVDDQEVPAVVKAMRLPQAEKEKKNRQLLRLKDAQELPSFQFRLHFTEPAPRCLRQLLQAQPSLAQQQHLPLAHGIASAMACLHDLPEPILHQELKPENAASEVYAFGVVCFEILTGQRAWEGRTDFQIMKAVGFDHERPHMDEQNAKTVLGKIIKELQTLRMARVLQTCWAAIPVAAPTFAALRRLFVVTQPQDLGRGRDAGQYPRRYSNLQLWSAWQIEHHNLWEKYMAERNDARSCGMEDLSFKFVVDSIETSVWKSKLEDASAGMPDELCAPIGEKYLLHGTLPEHLLHILDQGFNDKLASSKGMFGAGAYFAEDPEKIDQYTRPDPGYESPGLEDVGSFGVGLSSLFLLVMAPCWRIALCQAAFLAQLRDGSLEAWGHPDYGAPIPADIIASGQKHGLKRAWSTWQGGFLVELQNGEFHAWGNKEKGADIDAVKATLEREGVVQIWSTSGAFLAELTSGKVLTWGDAGWGGEVTTSVREALEAEGIHRAWSTHGAFIVELKSGRVVAWGRSEFGSQIPSDAQAAMRTKGLRDIWTTRFGAVVAQLNTGEVISWGDTNRGADVGGVKDRLEAAGVRHMWRSTFAFLAQLKTGEILCWGDKNRGGALPAATKEALDAHGIARAWSTTSAFLAELTNGSVVAWGVGSGAEIPDDLHSSLEREGIREAFGTAGAFLVVLKSGRCVAWGDPRYGADLSSVKDKLETDVGFNQNGGGKGALAYKAPEMFEEKFQMASEASRGELKCELNHPTALKDSWNNRYSRAYHQAKRAGCDKKEDSWAADPEARPRFAAICERLKLLRFPKKLSTAVPSYWSGTGDLEALDQGWAAEPVSEKTFEALKKLFVVTQPEQLGKGRDCKDYGRKYSNLQLHCAWQIEHPSLWDKYAAERNDARPPLGDQPDVLRNMKKLERNSIETPSWKSKLDENSTALPDELCAAIGEKHLLHGTSPKHLLDILDQGFNDKLASLKGMFGAGAYFAEDPAPRTVETRRGETVGAERERRPVGKTR
eukprot:g62.t1